MAKKADTDNNPAAGSVQLASDARISKYKAFRIEFDRALGLYSLFCSDELRFSSYCGIYFCHSGIELAYEKFVKQKVDDYFGCCLDMAMFRLPVCDVFDYIMNNRTIERTTASPVKRSFLGITRLSELKTGNAASLVFAFGLKDQVEHFNGWTMGKANPINGTEDVKQRIRADFEEQKDQVYGQHPSPRWQIDTEEGDIIKFFNLYDVCCWVMARYSNYSPDSMTKENW
jgi:hypothetical protein